MIDEIQPLYLLLGSTALLAAAASVSILRFQSRVRASAAFWNSPTGAAVQADRGESGCQDCQLAAQIDALRETVESLARERTPPVPSVVNSNVENAVLLARQGASVADLVQCCGLNAGEAQLLLRLHGSRASLHAA